MGERAALSRMDPAGSPVVLLSCLWLDFEDTLCSGRAAQDGRAQALALGGDPRVGDQRPATGATSVVAFAGAPAWLAPLHVTSAVKNCPRADV